MRMLLWLAILGAPVVFAESARFSADHEMLVAAARAAMAEEANIRPELVVRSDEQRGDGRKVTKLKAPYSDWPNLAARAETKITSGGKQASAEVSVNMTTGNWVWSQHKDFAERVVKLVGIKIGPHKLNDTRPTAEPAKPVPEPKALDAGRK